MNDKERMEFWGELAEPMAKMYGTMWLTGKHKWLKIVIAMQDKAEAMQKASEK